MPGTNDDVIGCGEADTRICRSVLSKIINTLRSCLHYGLQKEPLLFFLFHFNDNFGKYVPILPRDARSAKRGILIVSRPSARPSVRPSVTLTYRGRIGWVSLKVINRVISLGSSLLGAITSAI